MQADARWKLIYRHKPASMEPLEYIAQFAGPVTQAGLRPAESRRQLVAAVTSGGSPAEQAQRIGRSREAMLQGGWSQETAAFIAQMGGGLRS
jgi:hypothetical protein